MHLHDMQAKRTLKAQKLQEELASGKLEQVVSTLNNLLLFRLNKNQTGDFCSQLRLLSIHSFLLLFIPCKISSSL